MRAWIWTPFARRFATYVRWRADSHTAYPGSARLLDAARAYLDPPRISAAERLEWCSRCGEHLRDRDETGALGRDGIHARCYGH